MKLSRRSTGAVLLVWLVISALLWAALEAWTLADGVSANHITAVVHAAFYSEPGVFVWLAFTLGFLAGHFFWGARD